jgi:uncharacterized hydantoinase/oxoprolinase family protein
MKMSIKWHKECLGNMARSLCNDKEQLGRLLKEVGKLEQRLVFYSRQIERAEKEGRKSFDSEKFNMKNKGLPW